MPASMRADLDTHYIQVELARPVPEGGEARIRILKTYKDAKSYYREGDVDCLQSPARHQAQRRRPAAKATSSSAANIPVQVIEES